MSHLYIDLDQVASEAKSLMEIYGFSDRAAVELAMRVAEHNFAVLRGTVTDEQFETTNQNKG